MKYILSQITKNSISIQGNTPCPNIYIIELNQLSLLFLFAITRKKLFFIFTKSFLFFIFLKITLSLNLPRFLWFDLGIPRIILLRSPALGSEQAKRSFLERAQYIWFLSLYKNQMATTHCVYTSQYLSSSQTHHQPQFYHQPTAPNHPNKAYPLTKSTQISNDNTLTCCLLK